MPIQYLSPSLAEGSKKDISVFKKGRKCRKRNCGRVLSIYNPGPCSNAHASWWAKKEAADKERMIFIKANKVRKYKVKNV